MDSRLKILTIGQETPGEQQTTKARVALDAKPTDSQHIRNNHLAFALLLLVSCIVCWPTLKALAHAALNLNFCSQILAAPFITGALLYFRRNEVFRKVDFHVITGSMAVVAGLILYWYARQNSRLFDSYDALAAAAFAVVLVWIAGFYAVYGPTALRVAVFPLSCLLIAVPIPDYFLNGAIGYLQSGSTAIAHTLFQLLGIPVMRNGFLLALPGMTIEVAKECSSIRSSVALVITSLLAGYVFLRSAWKRAALVLIALPVSIFKNAVRIVTLSLLSIYVNPAFMNSDLHRDGGILFYILALLILFPIFRYFEKSDRQAHPPSRT